MKVIPKALLLVLFFVTDGAKAFPESQVGTNTKNKARLMFKDERIRIIDLPKIEDERGNLSFIEENKHIPFAIQRVYWIYDVPGGEFRGSHAFRTTEEFILALSGSFDVILNDGSGERKYSLTRSYYGIYIPEMVFRRLENFSTNSLALVLTSALYNPDDYIREFDEFLTNLR